MVLEGRGWSWAKLVKKIKRYKALAIIKECGQ